MAGPLADYPAPPGNKRWTVVTLAGPSSYTQISTGTPPTGGQVIKAQDVGLVDFDFVMQGMSDDGQYEVLPIFDNNPQRSLSQIRLLWSVASTGTQVAGTTNLSGRTVRLCAFGN